MKQLLVSSLAFIILSCSNKVYLREKFTYEQNSKQVWIDSYKYEAFYGCLNEGIQNDSIRIILNSKDLFNKNSDLDFVLIEEARKHGQQVIIKMPTPYVKVDKGEEYLKNKNFISYNCLVYYASRELDSIAKNAYQTHLMSIK
ncbi:hypothetical protein GV828_09905 [Flavobacterium sp. NST-5]|uniref:Lipoprotein n=1 Tax=Flavobacterium ichthyis TaxID=2698827 RepID=A0ABW9Z9E4_9FLAO|nr:hypothetical protein [Flavobacterium ichthyis]NBL65513.1 hypothetical protein [Flavobacterium ichthyis]